MTAVAGFDEAKFEQLFGKVLGDVGGAMGLFMAYIGDQSGIYKALEESGNIGHEALADRTGVDARYLREWLSANAAFGYVNYDADSDTFSLSPEQAALFAHEGEPTCMQGFFQAVVAQYATHDTALDVFRSGRGRPWGEHHTCCFCGTDRFFRPGYVSNLVSHWIPALQGVEDKLKAGARVADIGCGLGSSSQLLAQSYPNTQVFGFDFHGPSIDTAKQRASAAGLPNLSFDCCAATDIPGAGDYDLVCIFDALHDMGDPVGAARHIHRLLKPGGTFMLVEPMAGDNLAENLNLLSGIFYGFSTTICVPTSKAQAVGLGLGAQAGQKRLTEVLNEAGFSQVRRATETPTNMVLEAVA
ncbi:class I SAM-dependent methyltransferase [Parahaliea aestuarii]|uniref:Class I SAM-dependent methyltransferase n=1 Tax=Parahaliea aestuarii TaxID=1852021 RepID=A0A5C8ZT60_9GAMM|nr:class I SAM-dependent methyltransferase [Parahaliea aestuarii]TXS90491.1 class I SAM-dependent methyltransferase [Parahaliea aestuarii]